MTAPQTVIQSNYVDRSEALSKVFINRFLSQEFRHLARDSWPINKGGANHVEKIHPLLDSPFINASSGATEILGSPEEGVLLFILLQYYNNQMESIQVNICTTEYNPSLTQKWLDRMHELCPVVSLPVDQAVDMKFWMLGPTGASSVTRRIAVPTWAQISSNYNKGTTSALTPLMEDFRPAHGGQLLLWHGEPGTGKTFAIRSLALHWKDWCRVECIVDPESFFGTADYMMSVLLDTNNTGRDEWRLLILEDSGELLAEDARRQTGQGLSRMLNLTDGLIGQGLKAMILVTTNEALRTLHPAVSRPGRCASEIEFSALTSEEAETWLATKGQDFSPDSSTYTLAELFGQVDQFKGASGQKKPSMGLMPNSKEVC